MTVYEAWLSDPCNIQLQLQSEETKKLNSALRMQCFEHQLLLKKT